MKISAQEYRHAGLMTAIIAVVPLIFFPNELGLKINIKPLPFFLIELAYYWIIFTVLLKGAAFKGVFISGTICFFTRLAIGVVFAFLVAGMHGTALKAALVAGIYQYKPAMFLQVISLPFILLPILKLYFGSEKASKPHFVMQPLGAEKEKTASKAVKAESMAGRKIIGLKINPEINTVVSRECVKP